LTVFTREDTADDTMCILTIKIIATVDENDVETIGYREVAINAGPTQGPPCSCATNICNVSTAE
jgi:hypothetical protein